MELNAKLFSEIIEIILSFEEYNTAGNQTAIFEKIDKILPITSAISAQVHVNNQKKIIQFSNCVNFNLDRRFNNEYLNMNFSQIDPIVNYSYLNSRPITWKSALNSCQTSMEFEDFLSDHGLTRGISYLLKESENNKTCCTYTGICIPDQTDYANYFMTLSILLPYLHKSTKQITSQTEIVDEQQLTSREKDVITWVMEGKTYWEISIILSISERTVRFHISNIIRKLEAKNCSHAIVKAIRYKIISL